MEVKESLGLDAFMKWTITSSALKAGDHRKGLEECLPNSATEKKKCVEAGGRGGPLSTLYHFFVLFHFLENLTE